MTHLNDLTPFGLFLLGDEPVVYINHPLFIIIRN